MGKHSKNSKDKKNKLQQTIRIDNTDDLKRIKSKKRKINNQNILDDKLSPPRSKRIKKKTSKLKQLLIKSTIIILFICLTVLGIWQGIEMFKWQTIAKQMCQNKNSVVVDLKRRHYCNTWTSKAT